MIGERPLALARHSAQAHKPRGLLAADLKAAAGKCVPHFPQAVDPIVLSMDLANLGHQVTASDTLGARRAIFSVTIPAQGDETSLVLPV